MVLANNSNIFRWKEQSCSCSCVCVCFFCWSLELNEILNDIKFAKFLAVYAQKKNGIDPWTDDTHDSRMRLEQWIQKNIQFDWQFPNTFYPCTTEEVKIHRLIAKQNEPSIGHRSAWVLQHWPVISWIYDGYGKKESRNREWMLFRISAPRVMLIGLYSSIHSVKSSIVFQRKKKMWNNYKWIR